jgi:hypothetical protein
MPFEFRIVKSPLPSIFQLPRKHFDPNSDFFTAQPVPPGGHSGAKSSDCRWMGGLFRLWSESRVEWSLELLKVDCSVYTMERILPQLHNVATLPSAHPPIRPSAHPLPNRNRWKIGRHVNRHCCTRNTAFPSFPGRHWNVFEKPFRSYFFWGPFKSVDERSIANHQRKKRNCRCVIFPRNQTQVFAASFRIFDSNLLVGRLLRFFNLKRTPFSDSHPPFRFVTHCHLPKSKRSKSPTNFHRTRPFIGRWANVTQFDRFIERPSVNCESHPSMELSRATVTFHPFI